MKRSDGFSVGTFMIALFWIGLLAVLPFLSWYYSTQMITCKDKTIPFKSVTIYSNKLSDGEYYTKTNGKSGIKNTCRKPDNKVTSSAVTEYPTREIIVKGTYVEPVKPPTLFYTPPPEDNYSYGSTCRDGTHSNSVGRGTCSWHGGVAY